MNNSTKLKRLALKRQSVRILDPIEVSQAAGGESLIICASSACVPITKHTDTKPYGPGSYVCTIHSAWCSIYC